MKLHLRFYTFTINYIFMDLSTTDKESKTMTEMKLEKQLDLSSSLTCVRLPALGPDRAPVRIRCNDEVRWVPRPRLRFGEPLWAVLPSQEESVIPGGSYLPRLLWREQCPYSSQGLPLSPSSPALPCWEIVDPSLYHELNQVYIDLGSLRNLVEAKLSFNFGM